MGVVPAVFQMGALKDEFFYDALKYNFREVLGFVWFI